MTTTKKIAKVAKIAATDTINTVIGCAEYTLAAAPLAIGVTAVANKMATGTFDVKGAAISVAKNAAVAIGTIAAINTVVSVFNATNMAIHNCGEFADTEEPSVEEFDDWDDEDEEA